MAPSITIAADKGHSIIIVTTVKPTTNHQLSFQQHIVILSVPFGHRLIPLASALGLCLISGGDEQIPTLESQ
jgi:hypothetical protein